jgi:hypothetical protein
MILFELSAYAYHDISIRLHLSRYFYMSRLFGSRPIAYPLIRLDSIDSPHRGRGVSSARTTLLEVVFALWPSALSLR